MKFFKLIVFAEMDRFEMILIGFCPKNQNVTELLRVMLFLFDGDFKACSKRFITIEAV